MRRQSSRVLVAAFAAFTALTACTKSTTKLGATRAPQGDPPQTPAPPPPSGADGVPEPGVVEPGPPVVEECRPTTAALRTSRGFAPRASGERLFPRAPAPSLALNSQNGTPQMIPARDGTRLWTRVSVPSGGGRVPVIVERSPYWTHVSSEEGFRKAADFFNARGFAYVYQASRGVHRSEGRFFPYRHEVEDGGALVDWVAAQSWADAGNIGTFGCSYAGYNALAAAIGSRNVKAVYADGPVASEAFVFAGGVTGVDTVNWLYYVDNGEFAPDDLMVKASNEPDLRSLDRLVLGHRSDYWQEKLQDPRPTAPFWRTAGIDHRWQDLCVPTFITSVGEITATAVWEGMEKSGCAAAKEHYRFLFMPGEHCQPSDRFFAEDGSPEALAIAGFLKRHLQGGEAAPEPRARFRVEESGPFTEASEFPPRGSRVVAFDLENTDAAGGRLSQCEEPAEPAAVVEIGDDPDGDDACEPKLVATYTSARFKARTVIVGRLELHLSIESDVPDTDVFATAVIEGTNALLFTGGVRARYRGGYDAPRDLVPGVAAGLRLVSAPLTAVEVPAGDRIVLYLATTECRNAENPHTGVSGAPGVRRSARVKLLTGRTHGSQLVLQIAP